MFHKQHVQSAVGFLISLQLQIYLGIFSENIFQSLKILQNYGHESVALLFWPTLCTCFNNSVLGPVLVVVEYAPNGNLLIQSHSPHLSDATTDNCTAVSNITLGARNYKNKAVYLL